jgi:SAM-dependent methyltransferase
MDFGCGTGLVGQNLKEAGFQNICGIDISPKMLEKAEEKGCYSQLVNLKLNQEEHVDSVPYGQRGRHDFVTAAGLINNNFMDLRIFEQMLICLKPGGYLVFSARYSYLGHYWYTDALAELEKAGRIKFIQDESYFKYDQLNECVGKFTKTPVKVYIYQKVENDSVFACKNKSKLSSMSAATADSDQM